MADEAKVDETDKPGAEPEDEGKPEKPERESKAPETPAAPSRTFLRVARVWCALGAFFAGAAVYGLPPSTTFLWKPLATIPAIGPFGPQSVKVMILPALAVAAALAWLLFVKLKDRWDYLKPGQGRWVRATAYTTVLVLAAFGAWQLSWMRGEFWWPLFKDRAGNDWSVALMGLRLTPKIAWLPALAALFWAMIGYHLYMNRPKWADFLVETQSELRKVSWPATKEWVGSSAVVVVVVTIVSFFLFFVDEGLSYVLKQWKIGF
jgi:preprotein translocase SecE subunit